MAKFPANWPRNVLVPKLDRKRKPPFQTLPGMSTSPSGRTVSLGMLPIRVNRPVRGDVVDPVFMGDVVEALKLRERPN